MSMEIINLIALIVVPIAAVYIGQKLQDREQKRKDKIQIIQLCLTFFRVQLQPPTLLCN